MNYTGGVFSSSFVKVASRETHERIHICAVIWESRLCVCLPPYLFAFLHVYFRKHKYYGFLIKTLLLSAV